MWKWVAFSRCRNKFPFLLVYPFARKNFCFEKHSLLVCVSAKRVLSVNAKSTNNLTTRTRKIMRSARPPYIIMIMVHGWQNYEDCTQVYAHVRIQMLDSCSVPCMVYHIGYFSVRANARFWLSRSHATVRDDFLNLPVFITEHRSMHAYFFFWCMHCCALWVEKWKLKKLKIEKIKLKNLLWADCGASWPGNLEVFRLA